MLFLVKGDLTMAIAVRKVSKDPNAPDPREKALIYSLCRDSLYEFTKRAWSSVESAPFVDNWHIGALCDHLESVTKGSIERLLINIPPGCSKPCHEEGFVLERMRGRIRLADVLIGDEVLTHRGRFRRVQAVHEQGELPLLEVRTTRGRILRMEKTHSVMTARGWVEAGNLVVDDTLAVVHKAEPCGADTIPPEEARLLGYLIGDGGVKYGNTCFTNQDPEAIEDFVSCAASLGFTARIRPARQAFGATTVLLTAGRTEASCSNHPDRRPGRRVAHCPQCLSDAKRLAGARAHLAASDSPGGWGGKNHALCDCGGRRPTKAKTCWVCTVAELGGKELPPPTGTPAANKTVGQVRKWRRKHEIDGKCSYDKRVPRAVMAGSDEVVAEYLAAYWACDGCLEGGRLVCTTVSEGLARDHLHLLTRLGLPFSLRRRTVQLKTRVQGDLYVSWSLTSLGGQDTQAKFMDVIGRNIRHAKGKTKTGPRTDFDRVLATDSVVSVLEAGSGRCRCLTVEEDASFAFEDVAVHNSTLVAVMWPMWEWARDPTVRWFFASYDQSLSTRDSRRCRSLMNSDWYQGLFGGQYTLMDDQNLKIFYQNSRGGWRMATSVAGHGTGEHPDRIVYDDVQNAQQAESETERQAVLDWHDLTMTTRGVARKSRRVCVGQRLHPNDISAHLLKEGDWVHICLPMRFESGRMVATPLGWNDPRKEEGELLTPMQFPEAAVRRMERSLGVYGTAGQLQQRPQPKGGSMFREEWFKRIKVAPFRSRRVRYWDRAATLDGGAATAGVLMAVDAQGWFYVEDVVHGHWEPNERNRIMRATAFRDRSRYGPSHEPVIVVEAERGSTGKESFQNFVRSLPGFRIKEDLPTGSKDTRAEPWADALAAGIAYVVDNGESEGRGRCTWDVGAYVQEHSAFRPDPGKRVGGLKDRVDASSGAYNFLAGTKRAQPMRTVIIRKPKDAKTVRLMVCSKEDLSLVVTDDKLLLISFVAHASGDGPAEHGLANVMDTLVMDFADLNPAEEDRAGWEEGEDGQRPCDKVMNRLHGQKIWAFLTRRRDFNPELIILQDQGGEDRRARSVAAALAYCLHLQKSAVLVVSGSDTEVEEHAALNEHVVALTKIGRSLVVT